MNGPPVVGFLVHDQPGGIAPDGGDLYARLGLIALLHRSALDKILAPAVTIYHCHSSVLARLFLQLSRVESEIVLQVLWIGLGRFGRPMAENLQNRGHVLVLPSTGHAAESTAQLLGRGAVPLRPDTMVDVCGVCLPTPEDVASTLDRLQTEFEAKDIRTVVDFSTGHPAAARQLAGHLAERGINYVDAPVSGSIDDARTGALTTWVGASPMDMESVGASLLTATAANIFYLGSVGSGAAMKLTNQIVHIENMAAIGEGLRFAMSQGIDLATAVESMTKSSADSAMLRRFGASIAANDFEPRFALSLALKDVRYAEAEAGAAGLHLNHLTSVRERLEELFADGHGRENFSRLADPRYQRPPRGRNAALD